MALQNIFLVARWRIRKYRKLPIISSGLIQLPRGVLGVLISGGGGGGGGGLGGGGGGKVITGLKKSVLENKLYNSADHNPFGIWSLS